MNALEIFIRTIGLPEIEAMNRLQDANVISDNCVWARDVADTDCPKAIEFLREDYINRTGKEP